MTTAAARRSFRSIYALLFVTFLMALIGVACSKKTPVPPPPPPPAATGPNNSGNNGTTAITEFIAEPSNIERGQSAQLRWTVTGATAVTIDHGIGTVPMTGTQRVTPDSTITYTLTASGAAGDVTRSATVSVSAPAPPRTPTNPRTGGGIGTLETRVQSDLQDALFDYDSNNVRGDARAALTADADALKRIFSDFPSAVIVVEGHCDERGSAEYNLGLGDRRATAARDFLVGLGVPGDKLKTISYGKERPVCTESDESCWQRNRRAHFSIGQ